jgi:outer membrane protein, heavy metal efflux system
MYFAVILLAGAFGAQADTLSIPWRLDQLLAAVERNSPELAAVRAEQIAAEARIGPADRLPDPRLQLGLMNRSLPSLGKRSLLAMDQIQLTQMIPVPGKLAAATGLARAHVLVAAAGIEERRLALRARAADDFFEIDRVDRSLAVLEHTGPLLREIEGVVRARYSVGSASQAEVLRAQLELAKLEEELTGMRAMRAGASARLNALLQLPGELPIAVSSPCLPESLPTASTLLEAALHGNPALLARRARLGAAQAGRRLASRERWPDVELGVAYGQQPMRAEPGTERMLSLMLGATIPLWGASRQGAMRREAAAMVAAAEAELQAEEVVARGSIAALIAAFERAQRLRGLYRGTILPQARAGAAAALAAYRTGALSLAAVLESYLTVYQYELQLIQLDAEQARAVSGLEAATSLTLMDSNAGVPR